MTSRSDLASVLELGARFAVVRGEGVDAGAVADLLDLELGMPVATGDLASADELATVATGVRVFDIRHTGDAVWRAVDQLRDRITWPLVFVGDDAAIDRFAAGAPHLFSLLGGHVLPWAPPALDVEARLASLRAGTGLSDQQVIDQASTGTLLADPVFAEWLALLGRGDLLG